MSYNYITNRDSPNYTPYASVPAVYGMPRVIEGVTLHHWGDPNQNPQFDDVVNYLCRAGGNTSAHYVATGTGRKVACIVSPMDVAWHSGNAWGNARTIGIECDPRCRPEDIDLVAELVADIRSAYGDVPLYWHSYFTATACPGRYNIDVINKIDQLSYQKVSHPTDWGKVTDKNPAPAVVTPTPAPTPTAPVIKPVALYKVVGKDGKQIGAYAKERGAYEVYKRNGGSKVTLNGVDVTKKLKDMFETPSPTSQGDPNSGVPVIDKADYEATKARLTALEKLVQTIVQFLSGIFKNFKEK